MSDIRIYGRRLAVGKTVKFEGFATELHTPNDVVDSRDAQVTRFRILGCCDPEWLQIDDRFGRVA